MRFEVPQFTDIEAKIVGPLTWKQFVYVAGGAGFLLIIYLTLPFIFFVIFGIPIGILAGGLAFHKVNNQPFSVFLEAVVNYFLKSKLYLWRKGEIQTVVERTNAAPRSEPLIYTSKKTIASLSHTLETHNPGAQE